MPQPYIDDYFELTFPTSSYHFLWVQAKGVPIPLGGCVCFAGFSSPPASWSSEAFSLKKRNLLEGGGMKEWGGGCGGGHRLSAAEQKEHICRMFLFPLDRITHPQKQIQPPERSVNCNYSEISFWHLLGFLRCFLVGVGGWLLYLCINVRAGFLCLCDGWRIWIVHRENWKDVLK